MLRKTAFAFVLLTLFLGMSSAAFAQKTSVLRVVVVKTDNVAAYLQELEKGRELAKRIGVPFQLRAWQATFAGPNAGSIAVAIEYSSLTALADAMAKMNADKDMQAWTKCLDKVRTIVSDSIYKEL
jgi:hypothetical protein